MANSKTKLKYVGPPSTLSIQKTAAKDGKPAVYVDRPLATGATYDDLPSDHAVVKNLVAAKLLIPVPEASPEKAVSDSAAAKTGDDRSTNPGAGKTGSKGE